MKLGLARAIFAAALLVASPPYAWGAPSKVVLTKIKFASATQFRDALTGAIKATVAASSGQSPVTLERSLEVKVQSVFMTGNISKGVARAGLADAKAQLTSQSLYCAPPANGTPTSTCQAVAQALLLAEAAINALTGDGVGALSKDGPPSGSSGGSGGGGGGATHPPVS